MTTWTKKSPSASIDWLKTVTFEKDSDGFYFGASGIIKGKVPSKGADNFYRLAGTLEGSGSYLVGKTVGNFIQSELR